MTVFSDAPRAVSKIAIDPIRPEDAGDVVAMWRRYVRAMQAIGETSLFDFDEAAFRADGFGPRRAFHGIVARIDGEPVGYMLYHESYDIDRSSRLLFIGNLWVEERVRRHGVGRALMEAAKQIARDMNAEYLVWAVYSGNVAALEFYDRLGGQLSHDMVWMHTAVDND